MTPLQAQYRRMAPKDQSVVTKLILGLYEEDPSENAITAEKINHTFHELQQYPEKGNILVFEHGVQIIGYAILINFWSNEWGGNILHIDELYIVPEFRNKGIATEFIEYLVAEKVHNAVALQLEVTPTNDQARRLYHKLGFHPYKNEMMIWDLSEQN